MSHLRTFLLTLSALAVLTAWLAFERFGAWGAGGALAIYAALAWFVAMVRALAGHQRNRWPPHPWPSPPDCTPAPDYRFNGRDGHEHEWRDVAEAVRTCEPVIYMPPARKTMVCSKCGASSLFTLTSRSRDGHEVYTMVTW